VPSLLRSTLPVLAASLMALAPHALAAPASANCHFLAAQPGTAWPSGFVGPAGSSLAGNVDLTSLDVYGDSSQMTVRIGVRDLSQRDPLGSVGVQYDVEADVAMKRIHLDAATQVTGNMFWAFAQNLDETTGEPSQVQLPGTSTPIKGVLDAKSSTITLIAPMSTFGFHYPLAKGRTLNHWAMSSYRMAGTYATGGIDVAGDRAGTKRLYHLEELPCATARSDMER
jgi:hypothetical protein